MISPWLTIDEAAQYAQSESGMTINLPPADLLGLALFAIAMLCLLAWLGGHA